MIHEFVFCRDEYATAPTESKQNKIPFFFLFNLFSSLCVLVLMIYLDLSFISFFFVLFSYLFSAFLMFLELCTCTTFKRKFISPWLVLSHSFRFILCAFVFPYSIHSIQVFFFPCFRFCFCFSLCRVTLCYTISISFCSALFHHSSINQQVCNM